MSESLTEFLLARIAEDEAAWRQSTEFRVRIALTNPDMTMTERALAECEAKRRIVEGHAPEPAEYVAEPDECGACTDTYPCWTLRALALPYASHPDYREEWGS